MRTHGTLAKWNDDRGFGFIMGLLGVLVVVVAIAALGAYGYLRLNDSDIAATAVPTAATTRPSPSANFHCDGRTMCSQMTSCAEATYFIQHCPDTRMDGNNDGEPCEQQCNQRQFGGQPR